MPVEIIIKKNNQVTITSDNLKLVSLNQISLELLYKNYKKLLENPENVRMFLDGKPWVISKIISYVSLKRDMWLNGDPYSSFAIYDLESSTFIGTLNLFYREDDFAVMGYRNVIEIGIIIDFPYINKGIGREIASIAKKYIERTLMQKPETSSTQEILQRLPPTGIVVTAHPENKASLKLIPDTMKENTKSSFGGYGQEQPRKIFFEPLTSISHEPALSRHARL